VLFFYNQRIHSRLRGKLMDGRKCKYTLFSFSVNKKRKKSKKILAAGAAEIL